LGPETGVGIEAQIQAHQFRDGQSVSTLCPKIWGRNLTPKTGPPIRATSFRATTRTGWVETNVATRNSMMQTTTHSNHAIQTTTWFHTAAEMMQHKCERACMHTRSKLNCMLHSPCGTRCHTTTPASRRVRRRAAYRPASRALAWWGISPTTPAHNQQAHTQLIATCAMRCVLRNRHRHTQRHPRHKHHAHARTQPHS